LKALSVYRKNEMISRVAHCPIEDPHYTKKSDGSHSKDPTYTRQILPTVYISRRQRSRDRTGCHHRRTMPRRTRE
jgi:hypothetical protein